MNALTPLPLAANPLAADANAFRAAMRQLAGGVSVVTAGIGEDRTGLTATSPVSLSVDPPTMLLAVNRAASALPVIAAYRHFAVNLLAADQQGVAENFAGKDGLKGPRRYRDAAWTTLATCAPILEGALASVDCELEELIERHSHTIVIGRVAAVRLGDAKASALAYWRGGYERLGTASAEISLAAGLAAY